MSFQERVGGAAAEAAAVTPITARHGWIVLGVQLLIAACSVVLLAPTFHALETSWTDTHNLSYTHGYLIAAVCVWLLYRNRNECADLSIRPSFASGVLLALVSMVWLVMVRASIEIGHEMLMPCMLLLATATALGPRIATRNAFAYGYLYFAIPVWDLINWLLQAGTVKAVAFMLKLTSVPAWVDGNFVHLSAGVFEIAGGCSGLHFFIVGLALAALYGELDRDTVRVRVQLVAMAFAMTLITNWLRVYIIIVAGHLTDMQHYLVRVEHYKFGWAVFAVMMVVFLLLGRRIPTSPQKAARIPVSLPHSPSALVGATAVALAALAAGPLWSFLRPLHPAVLSAEAGLPSDLDAWSGPQVAPSNWQPEFIGADRMEQGIYRAGGQQVEALSVVYALQTQDRELTGYRNSVVGKGASVVSSGTASAGGYTVNEMVLEQRGEQSLLWYYYTVGSRRTTSGTLAQLTYGAASLRQDSASRLVAVRAACERTCDAARRTLSQFSIALESRAHAHPLTIGIVP